MKYSRLLIMFAGFALIPLLSYFYLSVTGFYENRPSANRLPVNAILPSGKAHHSKDSHRLEAVVGFNATDSVVIAD